MALVYAALVYRQHCFLRDSRVEMIGMGFLRTPIRVSRCSSACFCCSEILFKYSSSACIVENQVCSPREQMEYYALLATGIG